MLADATGIPRANRHSFRGEDNNCAPFQRKENSLQFSIVTGDMQISADLALFDMDIHELERRLQRLSQDGVVIALPQEESTPFDYLLFENGETRQVQIVGRETPPEIEIL